ncbi:uncharacterized protein CELE_R09E10.13 [Caenorhabditis elegans]|uniref:Uncharacterized protein n=1 Tax=Caenorhabditis elegans TaxID=6239 RepID=C6KRK7_CAEEL|nr:Uncharacterized protein CELE_R09E10.13 [Caenorhabditis elegans]CAZ65514.1 Uncharacterized protein CELE_R09E10.13 [Caenorhabditis elegans]|eukprot:NP_001255479.1 Uncharacterized protein CELE_R09E10.13 [Caenorhabditis elegans]
MASLKFNIILFFLVLCAFLQVSDAQFFHPIWGFHCGFHCRRFHRRMFWRNMLWG